MQNLSKIEVGRTGIIFIKRLEEILLIREDTSYSVQR